MQPVTIVRRTGRPSTQPKLVFLCWRAYTRPLTSYVGEGRMAAANFEKCFAFILQFEGGFTNDPKDPGGPTNLGITQATLSAFLGRQATIAEVKALTPEKVAPIYRGKFWDHVNGD